MTTKPIRVIVVDDSLLFRQAIIRLLQRNPNFQVVAEPEDGLSAVQAVEKLRPEVVLMDISMPVLNGLDATWIIKSKFPDIKVIILTMHDEEAIAEAARNAGACCWINKGCPSAEIVNAIMAAGNR